MCFQTGYLRGGLFHQGKDGHLQSDCTCIPRGTHWFQLTLEVRRYGVSVFVDGKHLTTFKPHLPLKASGGVVVASGCRRITRFKEFNITRLEPLPFTPNGCTSARNLGETFTLVAGRDYSSDSLCRAALNGFSADALNYTIAVRLYSKTEPQAVNIRFGAMFNVHNDSYFEFVYFR